MCAFRPRPCLPNAGPDFPKCKHTGEGPGSGEVTALARTSTRVRAGLLLPLPGVGLFGVRSFRERVCGDRALPEGLSLSWLRCLQVAAGLSVGGARSVLRP